VWTWSSERNTYTHDTLPADAMGANGWPDGTPPTPQQAADQALALAGRSTHVSVDGTAMVAHRRAYELVLAPKDTRSLVGQVRIAMDAEHSVPLRVRVFAKGADQPAFEVGFTQVSFATPGDEQFRFAPPRGATQDTGSGDTRSPRQRSLDPAVPEERRVAPGGMPAKPGVTTLPEPGVMTLPGHGLPAGDEPRVVGTGWTTVLVANVGTGSPELGPQFGALLDQLPRVSGSWGSGRELRGALFTLVLTDDGRLAGGLVAPELVYQALGTR
jgi:hypothetical protein